MSDYARVDNIEHTIRQAGIAELDDVIDDLEDVERGLITVAELADRLRERRRELGRYRIAA